MTKAASKILYLYVKGGPPPEHSFPRIAARAELHVLALMPVPEPARASCTSIVDAPGAPRGEELVEFVAQHAKAIGADAIITLSEFGVLLVAHVADRLGLAGAGPNLVRARDKRLMRETWRRKGVPIPDFRRVESEVDLSEALAELTPPVLLKPAWGAGSVAQLVLNDQSDVPAAWAEVAEALKLGSQVGMNELYAQDTDGDLLVEEIFSGTTDGWYPEPGHGDYVSVEGIVANGVYHPLCITARLPAIPPFTEVASTAPCTLPEHLQRRIEDVSRDAVDALQLDTCGTHTEIKLGADGSLTLIETGARFGGVMITREIEEVFGIDPIAMLVDQLLGREVFYPAQMLTTAGRAAASVAVIPTNAAGTPWRTRPFWRPNDVDWASIVSPGTKVEEIPAFSMPVGEEVPSYDPSGGSRNWLGLFVVTAPDARRLHEDCNAILDGLEAALNAVDCDE
ncbi:ATP-grasp domain-containing protein [Lentzea alba]|uniref:ATP-grasp domain-containing protein n=1 Tax=Lentzea alba TaxID=2714351 RepID=UPI0039BFB441